MTDPEPYRNVEQDALDAAADLFDDGHTGSRTPSDLEKRMPFLRAQRVGGADRDPFTDTARLIVDVFAATYGAGTGLAEAVRQRYRTAPDPFDRVSTITGPVEVPWSADSPVRRWTATYEFTSRRDFAA